MKIKYSEYSLNLTAPCGDVTVVACDTILQGLAEMQDNGLIPPISHEWWMSLFRHEAAAYTGLECNEKHNNICIQKEIPVRH